MALSIVFLISETSMGQRVTGQSAAEAFSSREYQKSYELYMILLESFPRDPLYLYGAGASLVNLRRLPSEAADLIERALGTTSAIRSVPADAHFYLARALHLSGRYDEALKAYELFSATAGRREARTYRVQELERECRDGRGALPESERARVYEPSATQVTVRIDTLPARVIKPPELLPVITDSILGEALKHRQLADSLRKDVRADTSLLKRSTTDSLKSDSLMAVAGLPVKVTVTADTAVAIEVPAKKVVSAGVQPVKEEPITSLFEVRSQPFYTAGNPIPVSSAFPPGLHYSIQMAVFRNPVTPSHFKGLYPVFGIKSPGSDLTYYYAGLFRSSADAAKALPAVRNQGFRDAFVVIFMDGKTVSAERGLLLERDWGTRGFGEWKGVVPATTVKPTLPADTVPPTLMFRVEVMRSNKRIDQRQLNDLERIAAERGLEIMNPSASVFVYIVGKFLTFESASAYADLLIRNGYKEARVAAYLGSREIPVETALKFFDR